MSKFGAEFWIPGTWKVNLVRYFSQVFESLEFVDVIPATLKTFFFGFFIGMIGCYKGFNATSGTEGVGKAGLCAARFFNILSCKTTRKD